MKEIKTEVKEKSMRQKREDGEITWKEYQDYRLSLKSDDQKSMREKYYSGIISNDEYRIFLAQQRGLKNRKEYEDYKAQQRGFKDYNAYSDYLALKKGFKDKKDYDNTMNHRRGLCNSQSENKNCPTYLGVIIAEQYLAKIFKNVQRMPQNHSGYDFICGKGYKIDVKSSCLYTKRNLWKFHIYKNKICDYFLLLAVDSRTTLNPEHIWLIKGIDLVGVKGKPIQLNDKETLEIHKTDRSLLFYQQFKQTEKLDKLIVCCNIIKQHP